MLVTPCRGHLEGLLRGACLLFPVQANNQPWLGIRGRLDSSLPVGDGRGGVGGDAGRGARASLASP
jgi:hypothetical protein